MLFLLVFGVLCCELSGVGGFDWITAKKVFSNV